MLQNSSQLPDLSVDFMSWLNTELRRRIEGEKSAARKFGLLNWLKTCFSRQ